MHQTVLQSLQYTWRVEGVVGMFGRGRLVSQILRDVPYAVITAIVYDLLQLYLFRAAVAGARSKEQSQLQSKSTQNSWQSSRQLADAAAGALAGGISTFLTTPMDVVKTRLMAGQHSYPSFMDAVRSMYKTEGAGAFLAGAQSRLYHKIPANGLFYFFYEAFRFALGAVETRSEQ